MKFIKLFFALILLTTAIPGQKAANCSLFTGLGINTEDSVRVVCLRRYAIDGNTFYLTVDPSTLHTKLFRSDSIYAFPLSWDMIRFFFSSTPYVAALKQAAALGDPLQDAGYTRFSSPHNGIDLTIDLCPSHHPLDRIVFTDLLREMGKIEKPVPVSVCLTGSWIREHSGDLRWLDSLVKENDLSIIWINHSFSHFFSEKAPLNENFMLAPGTDTDGEVLNNETEMLRNGIIPSVFFRFPGLVSDHKVYNRILELGLIPVGSDAWLAKGQKPGNGSIVLIHGNGNEPVGVSDFISLLKKREADLSTGRWELLDLRKSLIEDKYRQWGN